MNAAVRMRVVLVALLLVGFGCEPSPSKSTVPNGSASETASPSAAPASRTSSAKASPSPRELPTVSEPLPAGTYTRAAFRPPVTFALAEGWVVGSIDDGFFDVLQSQGTPAVVAVQFALVKAVVGLNTGTPALSAKVVAQAIHETPGVVVVDESDSRIGGLAGFTVVVENRSKAASAILEVRAARIGIDPERKLWISVFDTADGVVAVMVGGSIAEWDHALMIAEPVLESVVIGD